MICDTVSEKKDAWVEDCDRISSYLYILERQVLQQKKYERRMNMRLCIQNLPQPSR